MQTRAQVSNSPTAAVVAVFLGRIINEVNLERRTTLANDDGCRPPRDAPGLSTLDTVSAQLFSSLSLSVPLALSPPELPCRSPNTPPLFYQGNFIYNYNYKITNINIILYHTGMPYSTKTSLSLVYLRFMIYIFSNVSNFWTVLVFHGDF